MEQLSIPILYLHKAALQLKKPSTLTEEQINTFNTETLLPAHESAVLRKLKTEVGLIVPRTGDGEKKKKKVKNPNPLSCLPPKKKKKIHKDVIPRERIVEVETEVKRCRNRKKASRRANVVARLTDIGGAVSAAAC